MTLQYSDVIFYHCFEINSCNSAEKIGAYVNNQLHASVLKSAAMRLDMNQRSNKVLVKSIHEL